MVEVNFAKQLKDGTKKSHTMAENTSFVSSFLRGVVDEISYRQLVANFYFIYHALESEMKLHKDHEYVGRIALDGLARHDALANDCKYFYIFDILITLDLFEAPSGVMILQGQSLVF